MNINIKHLLFSLSLVFNSSIALSNTLNNEAELVVREFYNWHLSDAGRFSGLPLDLQNAKISHFFSVELQELLRKAALMEQQCVQNNADGDKPYYLEGSIVFGLYEGAKEVEISETPNSENSNLIFNTRGIYIDERFPAGSKNRVVSWLDRVVTEKIGDYWKISDIRHEEGSLKLTLSGYIEQGKQWCAASHSEMESPLIQP